MSYIPPYAKTLETDVLPQIRLGLQGAPGTGKTFAALTFPNSIVVNFDRGLGAHIGRKDVHEICFWDPTFVDTIQRRSSPTDPPNRRDAFEKWLRNEAIKFEEDQTLVVDGSTGLQAAFAEQEAREPVITRSGKIDDFAPWNHKVDYFGRVMVLLKALRCNVVYICHETLDRNKEGDLNGKVRPLLTGQFGDQLAQHFTDWFRQHSIDKPEGALLDKVPLAKFGCKDKQQFGELLKLFPENTGYWWQTEGDDLFNAKCSTLVGAPRFVPASYQSFLKYKRVISQQ